MTMRSFQRATLYIASYGRETRYCQGARFQRRCRRAPRRGRRPSATAESIRLELAEAWGEMGAAWGVTPGHRPRAGLPDGPPGAAHRARGPRGARPVATARPAWPSPRPRSWGIVERVPEPRRVGRRGPAGVAYLAVGDHWQWFGRVIAERKVREGDPIVAVIEQKAARGRRRRRRQSRRRASSPRSSDWLAVVRRLRPAVRPGGRARPAARAARARALAASSSGAIPDTTILRLFDLLGGLDDGDVLELVDALSRLSPTAARRATKLMSGVVRTVSR